MRKGSYPPALVEPDGGSGHNRNMLVVTNANFWDGMLEEGPAVVCLVILYC